MKPWLIPLLALVVSVRAFAAGEVTRPFLYEIKSSRGLCAHIFGSIHAGVSTAELPPVVLQKLYRSNLVVLETNAQGDLVAARQAMAELYAAATPPEGWDLSARLSAEAWETLVREVPSVPREVLAKLHPFQAGLLMHLDSAEGRLDQELTAQAQRAGIPLGGLETFEEVFAPMLALVERDPVKATANLEAEVRRIGEDRKTFANMLRDYRAGDEIAVARFMVGFDRSLLEERNKRWVGRIVAHAENEESAPVFFVVGAGHLGGEEGLFALLKARGFEVRRVSPDEFQPARRSRWQDGVW